MSVLTKVQKWKTILTIAWPLIIANSFWNLQLTIDRIFLGSYSTEALGAAVAVMGLFWTPMALLQQTASYVTTFVGRYFGSKELTHIGPALWQAIYVSVIGGLLFFLFLLFSDSLFMFIGHSPVMQQFEADYFNAICFSALPTAIVAAFCGFFTGLNQTKAVMKINAIGLAVNVVCDYILIFGHFGAPELGISGAGYATALSSFASMIYGVFLVFNSKNESLYAIFSGWRWNGALAQRFVRFGIPSGLQWALEGLAFTLFLIIMGRFENGEAALASSSIVVTIMMLSILPTIGIAQAVMTLVSQYIGKQDITEAEKVVYTGVEISGVYIVIMGLTFILFPHVYLSWFANESNIELWTEVSTIVPYLLMFVAFFTLFDSVNINFSFALKGAGDTKFVSIIALILPWPLMVIPTFFIREWTNAVFWAWGAASLFGVTQALVLYSRFKSGKWKSINILS